MQNKHNFFFLFGNPNFQGGGGAGQAGWAKIPTFTENLFWELPLWDWSYDSFKPKIITVCLMHTSSKLQKLSWFRIWPSSSSKTWWWWNRLEALSGWIYEHKKRVQGAMSNKICHTIKHAHGHFDDLDDYFDDGGWWMLGLHWCFKPWLSILCILWLKGKWFVLYDQKN